MAEGKGKTRTQTDAHPVEEVHAKGYESTQQDRPPRPTARGQEGFVRWHLSTEERGQI